MYDMEKPTQSLRAKTETQKVDDTPTLGFAMFVIGGFIIVAAIFALFLFTHL
jgi:hypothetical protein